MPELGPYDLSRVQLLVPIPHHGREFLLLPHGTAWLHLWQCAVLIQGEWEMPWSWTGYLPFKYNIVGQFHCMQWLWNWPKAYLDPVAGDELHLRFQRHRAGQWHKWEGDWNVPGCESHWINHMWPRRKSSVTLPIQLLWGPSEPYPDHVRPK